MVLSVWKIRRGIQLCQVHDFVSIKCVWLLLRDCDANPCGFLLGNEAWSIEAMNKFFKI